MDDCIYHLSVFCHFGRKLIIASVCFVEKINPDISVACRTNLGLKFCPAIKATWKSSDYRASNWWYLPLVFGQLDQSTFVALVSNQVFQDVNRWIIATSIMFAISVDLQKRRWDARAISWFFVRNKYRNFFLLRRHKLRDTKKKRQSCNNSGEKFAEVWKSPIAFRNREQYFGFLRPKIGFMTDFRSDGLRFCFPSSLSIVERRLKKLSKLKCALDLRKQNIFRFI